MIIYITSLKDDHVIGKGAVTSKTTIDAMETTNECFLAGIYPDRVLG